jgi:excisionase family DNA binding protein
VANAELSERSQQLILEKPFQTVPETAHLLNITKAHVYNLANRGEFRIVKVAGRSSGVPSDDLVDYINRQLTQRSA